jgi:hypothetical protein
VVFVSHILLPQLVNLFGNVRDDWIVSNDKKIDHGLVLLLQLVNLFGNVRDDWIASDLKGWLAPNKIYPGVADAIKATLKSDDTEVYIVTTKQVQ